MSMHVWNISVLLGGGDRYGAAVRAWAARPVLARAIHLVFARKYPQMISSDYPRGVVQSA